MVLYYGKDSQIILGPNLLIISFSSAARIDFSGKHFITVVLRLRSMAQVGKWSFAEVT